MESAIVLVIPEAQPLLESAWSETGAPRTGMPAHVTLLYPFVSNPDPGVVEELRFFFSGLDGFGLSFSGTGDFPEVVYLAPDEPRVCAELTEALVRRWPDFPPYSGMFEQVVPHLTVVKTPDGTVRERVRAVVEPLLPLEVSVCEASLWVRDDEQWSCLAEFPMGPPEP